MIRTGEQYLDSIRDRPRGLYQRRAREGRDPPSDVQAAGRHPRPHLRHAARAGHARTAGLSRATDEWHAIANKLPRTQEDWWQKRRATDTILDDIGGVVTRVGDETVGEMWSLYDGQDVLNEVDPQFSANIRRHVERGAQGRSVPRLGQHRSEGRSLQAAAGPGPRHAAARGQGDRCRHHRARRQVRDRRRLRQPGLHQADHRQLGQCRAVGLRGRLHLRPELAESEVHLPHRFCRPRTAGGLSAVQPLRRGRYAA